jgi:hypothetical protein
MFFHLSTREDLDSMQKTFKALDIDGNGKITKEELDKFISSKETFEKFKNALKGMGATKIQGGARESVARLWNRLGFKHKQILVEYKI